MLLASEDPVLMNHWRAKSKGFSIAFLDLTDFLINVYIAEQVISVGPGLLDKEGNRKPLSVSPGNIGMYSKYAGNEFKGKDGSDYIVLRSSDVMAVLSFFFLRGMAVLSAFVPIFFFFVSRSVIFYCRILFLFFSFF